VPSGYSGARSRANPESTIFSVGESLGLVGRRASIDSARRNTDRPSPCPGQTTDAVNNPGDSRLLRKPTPQPEVSPSAFGVRLEIVRSTSRPGGTQGHQAVAIELGRGHSRIPPSLCEVKIMAGVDLVAVQYRDPGPAHTQISLRGHGVIHHLGEGHAAGEMGRVRTFGDDPLRARGVASRAMHLRFARRRKDGKEHRYWSIVESRRCGGGRVVQRPVLYLGRDQGFGTTDPTHRRRCGRFHDALVGDRDVSARIGRMAGTCLRGKPRMVPWRVLRGPDC
jgi:hypothetical protein